MDAYTRLLNYLGVHACIHSFAVNEKKDELEYLFVDIEADVKSSWHAAQDPCDLGLHTKSGVDLDQFEIAIFVFDN